MDLLLKLLPPYLTDSVVWLLFWPFAVLPALLSGVLVFILPFKVAKVDIFLASMAFSVLGLVTGYITGFSREPAVGAVLPAVLSLTGALAVFLVGKKGDSRNLVSLAVLIFGLTLVLGANWGASIRNTYENGHMSQSFLSDTEKYIKSRALVEQRIRSFRKTLKLPELSEESINSLIEGRFGASRKDK